MLNNQTIIESDLDQLERHLDGALEDQELVELERRLQTDVKFASLLAQLKSERVVRAAAWQSMQGDSDAAARLQWRIRGAILQQSNQPEVPAQPRPFWNQWKMARLGSAAAACLVVGFFAGRTGRHQNTASPLPAVDIAQVTPVQPIGQVSKPTEEIARSTGPNAVPITDAYGRIVTYQRFATPEEARNFAEDLHGTHAETSSVVPGPSKLASQEQVPF